MNNLLGIFLILLCSTCTCIGQHVKSSTQVSAFATYLEGSNFEGVIFSQGYTPFTGTYNITQEFKQYQEGISQRFTPTISQIEMAERILQKNLRLYSYRKNIKGFGPAIHRKLPKYHRQYLAYTSVRNEKIIFINAGWEQYTLLDRLQNLYPQDTTWKYEYQIVMDGGSYFWRIEVNLTTGTLSGLGINGVTSSGQLNASKLLSAINNDRKAILCRLP